MNAVEESRAAQAPQEAARAFESANPPEKTTDAIRQQQRPKSLFAALGFAAATAVTAALSGRVSRPKLWYRTLRKSHATPPDWAFGPVWTGLYVAMAFSAWCVWRTPSSQHRSRALSWWAVQLAFNGAWSPVFFAAKRPRAALAIVVALLSSLAEYARNAAKVDRLAAAAVAPYVAWTGFATYLNAQIVKKNRSRL